MVALAWIILMIAGGTWWVRRDIAAFARFGELDDTHARQRVYRSWLVESFVVLSVASVVSLWLAGGLSPFDSFPDGFDRASRLLQSPADGRSEDWPSIALGAAAGIAVSVVIQWRRLKAAMAPSPRLDEALVPRNRREAVLAVLLSVNAGFSEELFFRLALPSLLLHATGSLAFALAASTICFGLAHAHYGWKGVLATMGIGGLLMVYYLHHGSLLRVMVIHIAIDVLALLVRPAIAGWFVHREMPGWASRAH